MQELIDVFKDNNVLILAIVVFILGLVLLGYLLTSILFSKKNKKIEKIEVKDTNEDKQNELEEMLDKMQKTLDKKEEIDKVSNFEFEQEESAIISYQELLQAAKKDFPEIETSDKDEILKPEVLEVEKPKEDKKFKNSVFISPIYGTKVDAIKPNTISVNKDNFEIENEMNEKFLEDLKNFRNNL